MADDSYEIFKMTIGNKIKFPREFDSAAKSLIKKLTKHDLSERFGNLLGGAEDIKKHRFFKHLNWDDLINKRIKPTYIPPSKELKYEKP
jgi:protein kinase X